MTPASQPLGVSPDNSDRNRGLQGTQTIENLVTGYSALEREETSNTARNTPLLPGNYQQIASRKPPASAGTKFAGPGPLESGPHDAYEASDTVTSNTNNEGAGIQYSSPDTSLAKHRVVVQAIPYDDLYSQLHAPRSSDDMSHSPKAKNAARSAPSNMNEYPGINSYPSDASDDLAPADSRMNAVDPEYARDAHDTALRKDGYAERKIGGSSPQPGSSMALSGSAPIDDTDLGHSSRQQDFFHDTNATENIQNDADLRLPSPETAFAGNYQEDLEMMSPDPYQASPYMPPFDNVAPEEHIRRLRDGIPPNSEEQNFRYSAQPTSSVSPTQMPPCQQVLVPMMVTSQGVLVPIMQSVQQPSGLPLGSQITYAQPPVYPYVPLRGVSGAQFPPSQRAYAPASPTSATMTRRTAASLTFPSEYIHTEVASNYEDGQSVRERRATRRRCSHSRKQKLGSLRRLQRCGIPDTYDPNYYTNRNMTLPRNEPDYSVHPEPVVEGNDPLPGIVSCSPSRRAQSASRTSCHKDLSNLQRVRPSSASFCSSSGLVGGHANRITHLSPERSSDVNKPVLYPDGSIAQKDVTVVLRAREGTLPNYHLAYRKPNRQAQARDSSYERYNDDGQYMIVDKRHYAKPWRANMSVRSIAKVQLQRELENLATSQPMYIKPTIKKRYLKSSLRDQVAVLEDDLTESDTSEVFIKTYSCQNNRSPSRRSAPYDIRCRPNNGRHARGGSPRACRGTEPRTPWQGDYPCSSGRYSHMGSGDRDIERQHDDRWETMQQMAEQERIVEVGLGCSGEDKLIGGASIPSHPREPSAVLQSVLPQMVSIQQGVPASRPVVASMPSGPETGNSGVYQIIRSSSGKKIFIAVPHTTPRQGYSLDNRDPMAYRGAYAER